MLEPAGETLKILIFSWKDLHHPWAGGSEVNMHEQAERWLAAGHKVTLFTSRPRGSKRHDNIDGVDVFRAGGRITTFLFAPIFYFAFLHRRADVILDIINGIPFATPLYSRKPVVGLIHHVHRDMFILELGPLVGRAGRAIERYLVPLVYRRRTLICVSESTACAIRQQLFGGRKLDVRVVFNGIDRLLYSPGDGQRREKPTVLYLGRLKPYKQLPRLIRIMHRVREEVPEAELVIAGGGESILEAQAEVKELGAEEYIHFMWEVSDEEKVDLYREAWVTATASLVEGWGLTVIEANACGTPAVAFNVPGLNESIVHGRTGMLAGDDEEFARHLADILTDEDLRGGLAARAVEWSNGFSWDVTADKTLVILEEAVRNSQARKNT